MGAPKQNRPPRQKAHNKGVKEMERSLRFPVIAEKRAHGWTLQQIADHCGLSVTQIKRDINSIREELMVRTLEDTERMRADAVNRRMHVIKAHLPIALDPSNEQCKSSADIYHASEQALAKLMGLDKPELIHTLNENVGEGDGKGPSIIIEMGGEKLTWQQAREISNDMGNVIAADNAKLIEDKDEDEEEADGDSTPAP